MQSQGLFRLNDSITITVTSTDSTFDLSGMHCDGQNGLHTYFAHQRYICDGVVCCEWAFMVSFTHNVKKIKGAIHKNCDIAGASKQNLMVFRT